MSERTEFVQYSRKEIEQLVMTIAKMRLIGNLYLGVIGEQRTKWNEDGSIDVFTNHTPSSFGHHDHK